MYYTSNGEKKLKKGFHFYCYCLNLETEIQGSTKYHSIEYVNMYNDKGEGEMFVFCCMTCVILMRFSMFTVNNCYRNCRLFYFALFSVQWKENRLIQLNQSLLNAKRTKHKPHMLLFFILV